MSDVSVLFVGANPIVRLFDAEGAVTAVASVWVADWSVRGSGNVLVLWHKDNVRVLGSNVDLARWLERDFTRHFPEMDGLAWPESTVEEVPVSVDGGLDSLHAKAGDVVVTAGDVLGRRTYATDAFDLGGTPHGLSLVLAPAASGAIAIGGVDVPGEVVVEGRPERPSSSVFLTAAEVWTRVG